MSIQLCVCVTSVCATSSSASTAPTCDDDMMSIGSCRFAASFAYIHTFLYIWTKNAKISVGIRMWWWRASRRVALIWKMFVFDMCFVVYDRKVFVGAFGKCVCVCWYFSFGKVIHIPTLLSNLGVCQMFVFQYMCWFWSNVRVCLLLIVFYCGGI